MNEHLTRALTFFHGAFSFLGKAVKELWIWSLAHKRISIPAAILLVAALGAIGFFLKGAVLVSEVDARREVQLVSVADVSSGEPITVIGEIRSVSEASVAPDIGGRVTRVYRAIGDYVGGGAIIAEIENSSERAALAQAEASFDRVKSGSALSGISLEGANAAAENARQNAYVAINDAVTRKADASFSNPTGFQPYFFIAVANSQLKSTLEAERLQISTILKRHASMRAVSLTGNELVAELEQVSNDIDTVRKFLSNLTLALSGAIATGSVTEVQITTSETDASIALSTVTNLQGAVSVARSGIKSATENLTQGRSGENADVALAQASLDAAKALLEKKIIRAPISGTISSISLEQGNFAAPGVPAVRIVNVSGLEAVAYLSERDLPRVTVGSSARISGIADGRVTRVAPALDPQTRKAEVKIAIVRTDTSANRFVAGQSATIELAPSRSKSDTAIFIPISSVKITPDTTVVFIVSEKDTLTAVPVTLGLLSGGKVEITSGLSLDNRIVFDARGLKEGQEVVVSR